MTRKVIGLQLDKSKIGEGQISVDWTILEHGDGAVLQLIYYGDDQTLITASATVEKTGRYSGTGAGPGMDGMDIGDRSNHLFFRE